MSEMVDRATKIIFEHFAHRYGQEAPVSESEARLIARAIIEAMREPTQAMLDAAFELSDPGGDISVSDLDDVFSDMIDAALK